MHVHAYAQLTSHAHDHTHAHGLGPPANTVTAFGTRIGGLGCSTEGPPTLGKLGLPPARSSAWTASKCPSWLAIKRGVAPSPCKGGASNPDCIYRPGDRNTLALAAYSTTHPRTAAWLTDAPLAMRA